MKQNFVTVAISADRSKRDGIENHLNTLNNPAARSSREILGNSKLIHFMSASLVRGEGNTDFLIFEISVDGPVQAVLDLFDNVEDGFSQLFDPLFDTLGYGGSKAAVLKANLVKTGSGYFDVPGLNFSGVPGLSVSRIKEDYKLARGIREYFDKNQPSGSALGIFEALKRDIEIDPHFTDENGENPALKSLISSQSKVGETAKTRKPTDPRVILQISFQSIIRLMWPVVFLAGLVTYFLVPSFELSIVYVWSVLWRFTLVAIAGLSICALTFFGLLLRRERNELGDISLPDTTRLMESRAREDIGQVQNHLTGVSKIKPGILRKISLRLTFLIIEQLAKCSFRPGYLSEIGTINFARWFQIPGTDKLVFCSNYSGSWESYLEDFISQATKGLTGVWSNTLGFPKTRLLFFEGANSGEIFKRWARRQQIPTRFWYSAYPHLTTERIRKNAEIRKGLSDVSTATQAENFLSLFGSAVRPHNDVERDEIQTLLFKGLGRHTESICVLLKLPDDANQAKAWLKTRLEHIGFDGAASKRRIDQIAFSASGLKKLGLNEPTLSQFSYPFLQGMDHEERSRVLADTGDDNPAQWEWGHQSKSNDSSADCAYLVYLKDEQHPGPGRESGLQRLYQHLETDLENFGGRVIDHVETSHSKKGKEKVSTISGLPSGNGKFHREPFGFIDGVSQPIVKGLKRGKTSVETPLHHTEPGEFILGYPDNRGTTPLGATMEVKYDPHNILSDYVQSTDTLNPVPSSAGSQSGLRDFSKNGSYLVIRHLEQDVDAFDAFLEKAANDHKGHKGIPQGFSQEQVKAFLGAKIMGRWKDGTSLVKYPYEPGTGWDGNAKNRLPDNDFLLGKEDPKGLSCPFGSHVRRTNPRDSFAPHSEKQLAIVNRHRILRRGRFFNDPFKNRQGLLFMCFNADIERQFEFIQQTWCQSRQFMGLDNEVDPILGRGGKMGRVTIPTEQGPIFLKGTPDAVKVLGGGYFFTPSKTSLKYLAS